MPIYKLMRVKKNDEIDGVSMTKMLNMEDDYLESIILCSLVLHMLKTFFKKIIFKSQPNSA